MEIYIGDVTEDGQKSLEDPKTGVKVGLFADVPDDGGRVIVPVTEEVFVAICTTKGKHPGETLADILYDNEIVYAASVEPHAISRLQVGDDRNIIILAADGVDPNARFG